MPRSTVEFEDRDRGFKKLRNLVKNLNGAVITVGIHQGVGSYPKSDRRKKPLPVAVVGFINEFGLPKKKIPERSFMRSTFDEQNKKWVKAIERNIMSSIRANITADRILIRAGKFAKKTIRSKIEFIAKPVNAPRTVSFKPKIGNTPLIETRKMKRAINFRIKKRRGVISER